MEKVLTSKQKALDINLNNNIYGTFAEIGAGQETVRHFYRAGGTSGTLAKAISAYDKAFSDAIYGIEDDKRYVTESRLRKMLNHETSLLESRIDKSTCPNRLFFTYANTVTTIDFAKRYKGHGWVGIKFKLDPIEQYNQIILHIRFKQNEARLQQETLGILGTNLIYGAFNYYNEPKKLLKSLLDNIDKDSIEIDTINFEGPRFLYVDNRLMSLQLMKNEMTSAVVFDPNGNNLLAGSLLYKKNIFTIRGKFRPVTNLNLDMLQKGKEMFFSGKNIDDENTQILFEITLNNLKRQGEISDRDFLDRADILCSLGHTVLISNFSEYYKLVEYYRNYTQNNLGLVMGVDNLVDIFKEEYYEDLMGGTLEALGKLFTKNTTVYLYPMEDDQGCIINSENIIIDELSKELYKYFKYNKKIVDIEGITPARRTPTLKILDDIISNVESEDVKNKIPTKVLEIIRSKNLFGYPGSKVKNNEE